MTSQNRYRFDIQLTKYLFKSNFSAFVKCSPKTLNDVIPNHFDILVSICSAMGMMNTKCMDKLVMHQPENIIQKST